MDFIKIKPDLIRFYFCVNSKNSIENHHSSWEWQFQSFFFYLLYAHTTYSFVLFLVELDNQTSQCFLIGPLVLHTDTFLDKTFSSLSAELEPWNCPESDRVSRTFTTSVSLSNEIMDGDPS